MKFAPSARHIEVQVLADQYHSAISLFGRDCSIQRRHQKIIEEAPAIIAESDVLKKMEQVIKFFIIEYFFIILICTLKDAVKLAKMVGYVSAGTVEYLYNPQDCTYYFLELNPRLQVEHPCTEMITDVNLPACQLQIAMGIPLHRIKDIRLFYGESPWSDTYIDFENSAWKPDPNGHVIAARITSENPDEGFKPSSGTVNELTFLSSRNVWGYFSVRASGGLHEFADSQFGHCFSWGENREDARENMVLALKELSIRGDFRTTVEYLIKLLETEKFLKNNVDTGWLDRMIADRVQTEKPDLTISLVCAALHIADKKFEQRIQNFQSSLERGQILPLQSLNTITDIDLIHENVQYKLQASKFGPHYYFVMMNNSFVEVEAHRMNDGSLLVNFDGSSYVTFMIEEVSSYRLMIGIQTCVFQKENDPTLLRAPSAGKLIQFLIENGGRVKAGDVYAEIEVMKMIMELRSSVSGTIHHVKIAGSSLELGMLIARLTVDDDSLIQKVKLNEGKFPKSSGPKVKGNKLHQVFHSTKESLSNILDGYSLPEPYFKKKLNELVNRLMNILRDPSLPLLELQDTISTKQGKLPIALEKQIYKLISQYASNLTSILAQFPSQEIASLIDTFADSMCKKAERETFFSNVQCIVQLVQRYRNGIKGHMKSVIQDLLKQYINVEKYFQHANFDKCITKLRELHKDNVGEIVNCVFSHANFSNKNQLVVMLIDLLFSKDPTLTDDLTSLLQDLTQLNNQDNSKVVLKARQVLIAFQQPPYEQRHNQMESMFLSAIDMYGHKLCQDNLNKLILSETSIFDVLHSFFFHANTQVRQAALEVYVRRSYIAYELNSVQHYFLSNGNCVVEFKLQLPTNHPNRILLKSSSSNIQRVSSHSENIYALDNEPIPSQRIGSMAAFDNWDIAKECFDELLRRYTTQNNDAFLTNECEIDSSSDNNDYYETIIEKKEKSDESTELSSQQTVGYQKIRSNESNTSLNSQSSQIPNEEEQPINILNVFIRDFSNLMKRDDETLAAMFDEFTQTKVNLLKAKQIRRLTFSVAQKKQQPSYFTFRARDDYIEDKIYRHLEPALAFQLEIYRLRSFHLELIPTANLKMHLYLGKAKSCKGQEVTDHRFFVRCIIRHSDLITKEASYEYLQNEAERTLLEALNELEVAFSYPLATKTDCNHIYMCFVPCVCIDPFKVEESVRSMVMRYGSRLWKLRVLQAELKMTLRLTPDGEKVPIRIYLTNESGYYLDISVYKEIGDKLTGETTFESLNGKGGPLHGRSLRTPYFTRDQLQLKRFSAQSNGTTYVYDIPGK